MYLDYAQGSGFHGATTVWAQESSSHGAQIYSVPTLFTTLALLEALTVSPAWESLAVRLDFGLSGGGWERSRD